MSLIKQSKQRLPYKMNKTNFKLALGVFVENEENFEIKEIFNFICENSPFFKTELKIFHLNQEFNLNLN
jgi:hypothetical protein